MNKMKLKKNNLEITGRKSLLFVLIIFVGKLHRDCFTLNSDELKYSRNQFKYRMKESVWDANNGVSLNIVSWESKDLN